MCDTRKEPGLFGAKRFCDASPQRRIGLPAAVDDFGQDGGRDLQLERKIHLRQLAHRDGRFQIDQQIFTINLLSFPSQKWFSSLVPACGVLRASSG